LSWRSAALAAVLVVVSVAAFAQPVPPSRIQVQSGGAFKGWAKTLNLDATDYAVTCTSDMSCAIVNGTNTTELGSVIGDVCTDFPTIAAGGVDMSCTALELPNGTATVSADCDAAAETGRVFVDSNAALYAKGQLCEGASGWAPMGNVYTEGRSGGQIVRGGTATTDVLDLRASAAAGYKSTIKLAGGTPTLGGTAANYPAMTLLPDGATADYTGFVGNVVSGLAWSSTITQSVGSAIGLFRMFDLGGKFTTGMANVGYIQGSIWNPTIEFTSASAQTVAEITALYTGFNLTHTGGGAVTVTKMYNQGYSTAGAIPSGVTVTDLYVGNEAISPTVTGVVTRMWGHHAKVTTGTDQFPYGATEHTISASAPPANEGVWGVETAAPGRFYYKNESGHLWRMGYTSWTVTIAALAADNTTRYLIPNGTNVAADTTEANVDTFVAPGALKMYAIACTVGVAPANGGGTQTRTFTVRTGAAGALADTGLVCSGMSEATQVCTGRLETGAAATAGQRITIAASAAGTPAATIAAESTCTIWWNLDAF